MRARGCVEREADRCARARHVSARRRVVPRQQSTRGRQCCTASGSSLLRSRRVKRGASVGSQRIDVRHAPVLRGTCKAVGTRLTGIHRCGRRDPDICVQTQLRQRRMSAVGGATWHRIKRCHCWEGCAARGRPARRHRVAGVGCAGTRGAERVEDDVITRLHCRWVHSLQIQGAAQTADKHCNARRLAVSSQR